jgi:plasmid maintenance system antidote protein VapI
MIWLRLQQAYDLKKAELELGEEIKRASIHHAVFQ